MPLVSTNAGPEKVASPSVLDSQHGSVRPLAAEDLERVAALFLAKFRRRRHLRDRAVAETAAYMREIYLDPAGQSGPSNALVQINPQGDLGGFLGVLKARYELNGTTLKAAIIGPLMADPGTDHGSAGPQLLRVLHQGEFDLYLTDSANRVSLAFARPMKYQLLPVHCLGWTCIFRPAAMAAAMLHRRWPGLPRLILDPGARAFDALAKRRFGSPIQPSSSHRVHHEPMDAAQFAERLPGLLSDYALRPRWENGELPRLLTLAAEKRADGPLHFGGTYDETGKMLGCHAFYGQAGGIANLLQIQASGSHWGATLDGLVAAAWDLGCVGITGQTQSRFMPQLFGYRNVFFRYAGGTMVRSRIAEVTEAVRSGDIFIGGLMGDRWTRLSSDDFGH
ncbi:hypothetical protein NKI77_03405 [Mesorhizobium opportunistum]|uniref:BioF2-like acetyltransferase domain-containing protein n=1 Tax=Mesorhizobium opportunistum TaxID=593909 RepID=A0ABV1YQN1_9HYPH|nr:hypothetical protein [Mesorhizobium sp.]TIN90858.1 MAG: hypothetical protein E5Y06_30415 [Mesorhizobium sp.]TJU94088.1 MAG: hypothetical protein E5Y08_31630 [Mesorhizobium sp.]TJV13438.1 MAG: hypothetical protein E5Y07_31790 [Mesorhizobium sp.]